MLSGNAIRSVLFEMTFNGIYQEAPWFDEVYSDTYLTVSSVLYLLTDVVYRNKQ
jgi:hypothetical protein